MIHMVLGRIRKFIPFLLTQHLPSIILNFDPLAIERCGPGRWKIYEVSHHVIMPPPPGGKRKYLLNASFWIT